MTLAVSEIFYSIQGESTRAGLPCAFVRLSGCNLDCTYCDTRYARSGGEPMELQDIERRVSAYPTRFVTITGGEPLLHQEAFDLAHRLADRNFLVQVETNGSLDASGLDARIHRILDVKCPGSGMSDRVYWDNLEQLRPGDEVKFVVTDRRDFEWALDVVARYGLAGRVPILVAPAVPLLKPETLAQWVLEVGGLLRLQLQLHKVLWPHRQRGV